MSLRYRSHFGTRVPRLHTQGHPLKSQSCNSARVATSLNRRSGRQPRRDLEASKAGPEDHDTRSRYLS